MHGRGLNLKSDDSFECGDFLNSPAIGDFYAKNFCLLSQSGDFMFRPWVNERYGDVSTATGDYTF